jgi:hypothetical protein
VKQTHGPPDGEAFRAKTPPPDHRNRFLAAFLVGGGPGPILTSTMDQLTNQEECLGTPSSAYQIFFFVISRLCISNKVPYPTVLRIRIQGSGAFLLLDPGSGIDFLRIPDPKPKFFIA